MSFKFKKKLFSMCVILTFVVYDTYSQKSSSPIFRIESGITLHTLHNSVIGKTSIISVGMFALFPTTLNNVYIRLGANCGEMNIKSHSLDTDLLLSNISLTYPIRFLNNHILLSPSLSLLNCALHLEPSDDLGDVALIATWENEFGVGAGADISLQYNRFIIYVPFALSSIFSSKPAYIFSGGLRIGINFNLRPKHVS